MLLPALSKLVKRSTVAFAFVSIVGILFPNNIFAQTKTSYFVNPSGSDGNSGLSASLPFKSIQKAIDLAQGGDTINLASGSYLQDILSKRSGTKDTPITIKGPVDAVVKGGGRARVFEINHDYITLEGFTMDGFYGSSSTSKSSYRDKLLYLLGKETRKGVTGVRILDMTIKNAGGECIRLRYFAKRNEIAGNKIENCGIYDFKFNSGGKNGEGVYIGTAPEQLSDGKNPTNDPDMSTENWIHNNTFNTQGNECVDIKESSVKNIIENNTCTGQKDSESAGFDSRGEENIFRNNESFGNKGAGVRLGGDSSTQGIKNHVYKNNIHDNAKGGIKFQRTPQGEICENTFSNNSGGNSVGSYGSKFNPTQTCGSNISLLPVYSSSEFGPSENTTTEPAPSTSTDCKESYSKIISMLKEVVAYIESL